MLGGSALPPWRPPPPLLRPWATRSEPDGLGQALTPRRRRTSQAEVEALKAQNATLLQELEVERSARALAEGRTSAELQAQLAAAEAENGTLKAAFEGEKAAKAALEEALKTAVEARVKAAAAALETRQANGSTEGGTAAAPSYRLIVDNEVEAAAAGVVPSEAAKAALVAGMMEESETAPAASRAQVVLLDDVTEGRAAPGRCLPQSRCTTCRI